jgi:PAS domain S-box-containing protein
VKKIMNGTHKSLRYSIAIFLGWPLFWLLMTCLILSPQVLTVASGEQKQEIFILANLAVITILAILIIYMVLELKRRQRAKEALRNSEERFRQLAENIGSVFHMTEIFDESVPGRILYVSPAYEKIWGASRESLYLDARTWVESIHPRDRERIEAALPQIAKVKFDMEYRIVRPDAGIRWIHDRIFPIYDEQGKLYRIAGIAEDITERKKAEENLAREMSFSDTALDSLPGIFYLFDIRGRYLRWNKNFERVTGYTHDEIAEMHPLDFITVKDRQLVAGKIGKVFTAGEAAVEAELSSKDGRATAYFFTGRRIYFDGRPCIVGMAIDITERRQAEEAMQQLTGRLLQSQDEERRRIAAELHDSLGQSLAIIKNRVMICLRAAFDEGRVREQLEEISATVTSAIDEVREITHNLRPYELDRLGLVAAIKSMIRKVSDSSSIRFHSDLEQVDGLLSKEAETSVYRIVQEGLNNVIKHADATEARVTIKRDGPQVVVTVRDNGKGIIIHNKGGNGKNGSGFGLAGIAERARMLGGFQQLISEPGQGTILTVRLGLKGERDERKRAHSHR